MEHQKKEYVEAAVLVYGPVLAGHLQGIQAQLGAFNIFFDADRVKRAMGEALGKAIMDNLQTGKGTGTCSDAC